jgi:hypothetical protein
MSPEDDVLFDAASPATLRRLLRRRGAFVSAEVPKEELRLMFGYVFSFEEFKELKSLHCLSADRK